MSGSTAGSRARRVSPRGSALAAALVAGALAAGAGSAAAAPAPPPPRYVALGDSWAAGAAAGELDPGSGTCRRSRAAYPELVARAAAGTRWLSRACAARDAGSGNTQFGSLSPSVAAVTATVGADAVGLGELLRSCSTAGTPAACDTAAARTDRSLAELPRALDAAIVEMRRAAPRAAVTFVGYPRPAEGAACPAGAADARRAARVDGAVDRLDAVLLERTRAAAVRFVDVRAAFAGHGACGAEPWLTPWTGADPRLVGGPNAAGHADGYRPAVEGLVAGALAVPADALAPAGDAVGDVAPDPAASPSPSPSTPPENVRAAPAGAPSERGLFAG